jgi:hypothetical protein
MIILSVEGINFQTHHDPIPSLPIIGTGIPLKELRLNTNPDYVSKLKTTTNSGHLDISKYPSKKIQGCKSPAREC